MKNTCLICERIEKGEKNDFFVAKLQTGIVVLGDHQYFYGYTLFLSFLHVEELHLHPQYELYLTELSRVGEAVFKAFKPKKLNYEILGNKHPHLHTHIFPRSNDHYLTQPVFSIPENERNSPYSLPSVEDLKQLKDKLRKELLG